MEEAVERSPRRERNMDDLEHLEDALSRGRSPPSVNGLLHDDVTEKEAALMPVEQICTICQKTFANVYRLQRHMISHQESSELRKFKCLECGKAFKFKHHLKEHCRIHSGEKPFSCSNCGKRFSHSGSYSSHMTSKKCWVGGPIRRDQDDTRPGVNDKPVAMTTVPHDQAALMAQHMAAAQGMIHPQLLAQWAQLNPMAAAHAQASHAHAHAQGFFPFGGQYGSPLMLGGAFQPQQSLVTQMLQLQAARGQLPPADPAPEPKPEVKITPDSKVKVIKSEYDDAKKSGVGDEVSCTLATGEEVRDVKVEPAVTEGHGEGQGEGREGETERDTVRRLVRKIEAEMQDRGERRNGLHTLADCARLVLERQLKDEAQDDVTEVRELEPGERLRCRHCNSLFPGPIDLHQHERYLCPVTAGRDVQSPISVSTAVTKTTVTSPGPSPLSLLSDRAEEEPEQERQRVRAMFTDAQLEVLRQHYSINPRPTKDELFTLAARIGHPKRVVQVWFQNSRARDRRLGQMVGPVAPPSVSPVKTAAPSFPASSAFVPPAPTPLYNSSLLLASQQPINGHVLPTAMRLPVVHPSVPLTSQTPAAPPVPQDGPLDLSVKKRPLVSGLPSPTEGEVLNLSVKPYTSPLTSTPRGASPHRGASPGYAPGSPSLSEVSSPRNSLESSFNSSLSLDSGVDLDSRRRHLAAWAKTTEHLDSYAAGLVIDEDLDEPLRKKVRRTWRGHRLEECDGLYQCDQCDKTFNKQSSLARHKYEHSGQRPFPCDVCSKAFKHKHHLTEHRRLHSGEKPFECQKCGKRFSHSGSYSQHMNHRYKYCKPLRMEAAAAAAAALTVGVHM